MKKKLYVASAFVGAFVLAAAFYPPLRGPCNRVKIAADKTLTAEFAVDNLEARLCDLRKTRCRILAQIDRNKHDVELNKSRLRLRTAEAVRAKSSLVAAGTADLAAFNRLKALYEAKKAETDTATSVVERLEKTNANLAQLKSSLDVKITELAGRVAVVRSKSAYARLANDSAEFGIEKSYDDHMSADAEALIDESTESAELELSVAAHGEPMLDKRAADAYLANLK